MRILGILLLTAFAASPAAFAAPAVANVASLDAVQVEKRTVQLDQQSRATLGVSIRALGLLLQASHGSSQEFLRKDSLIEDGSWPHLQELVKNGYVKISTQTGTPDGSDTHTEFVVMTLTGKGKAAASAIR